jgi:hypothetical protein
MSSTTSRPTQRQLALDKAYAAHPERFFNGSPLVQQQPEHVWINQDDRTAHVMCTQ